MSIQLPYFGASGLILEGGVRYENNITSINTEHEWDKEDQLIFASQAKQVFYIQEPSRGNQNNNHRCIVEHVNHRKIWDLPFNDSPVENVQNVDHDIPEDLDVVHNNSSSGINLLVDFRQYFPNSYATHVEPTEVPEKEIKEIVEVSEGEIDEVSDDGSDYYTEGSDCDTEVSEGEMSEGSD